ncbi:hypothetical protein TI39_contig298g00011 [Zymoseptoria brevis]|uniref:Uncharacterized protein n=1 Tax=Zymoseptoria brevis TaxID=1047168 RepID=A0A0F4GV17_9PEZI|nr:hypothetical protein TI39_contig298g00011 [Zymoseptoria brevis]
MQIFQLSVILALASSVMGYSCGPCDDYMSCRNYPLGACGPDTSEESGVVACYNQCPFNGHSCNPDGNCNP